MNSNTSAGAYGNQHNVRVSNPQIQATTSNVYGGANTSYAGSAGRQLSVGSPQVPTGATIGYGGANVGVSSTVPTYGNQQGIKYFISSITKCSSSISASVPTAIPSTNLVSTLTGFI